MIKLDLEQKDALLDVIDSPGFPVLVQVLSDYCSNAGNKLLTCSPDERELLKHKLVYDGTNGLLMYLKGLKKIVNNTRDTK